MAQNTGLGRGLSSLIPQKNNHQSSQQQEDVSKKVRGGVQRDFSQRRSARGKDPHDIKKSASRDKEHLVHEIARTQIRANELQPRMHFDEEKLDELTHSIKEHGILQPLIVMPKNAGRYELIAGERRLQAAARAGLEHVPVIIYDRAIDEQKKLELALVENIQRHDLNVVEEARAYKKLATDFNLSQQQVAQRTGKSRSAVANRMRLTQLPVEMQHAIADEKITEGHAKAILSLSNPQKQYALFTMIISQKLTVRQAEEKTKNVSVRSHVRTSKNPEIKALEEEFTQKLGTRVKVIKKGEHGKIIVEYHSSEDLDRLRASFCADHQQDSE